MRTVQRLAGALLAAAEAANAAHESVDELAVREHVGNLAQIAMGFAGFAGSDENAVVLVESLRTGEAAELRYPTAGTDPEPKTVVIDPPTPPLDWHDVRMCMMLARDALTAVGVLRASGEQLRAALLGGEVAVPGIRKVAFRGVLRMRVEGCTWGEIAAVRYERAPVSRIA